MSNTLGMTAQVRFGQFGGRTIDAKVDTGATMSSLHAEQIQMNKGQNTVSFVCAPLSNNRLTLQLDGSQEVHSADAGGVTRPVVKLDVEVNGVTIKDATFNLNDRSGMDIPVLLGQNVLKAGDFVIDPNKSEDLMAAESVTAEAEQQVADKRKAAVLEAMRVIFEHDVTIEEMTLFSSMLAEEHKRG